MDLIFFFQYAESLENSKKKKRLKTQEQEQGLRELEPAPAVIARAQGQLRTKGPCQYANRRATGEGSIRHSTLVASS